MVSKREGNVLVVVGCLGGLNEPVAMTFVMEDVEVLLIGWMGKDGWME